MFKEILLSKENIFSEISKKIEKILTDKCCNFNTIAFVGNYKETKEFLSIFIHMTKPNIEHVELYDDNIYDYKDEYLVSITNYDEINLYCEKFKSNSSGCYKFSDAEVVFLMEDCNSKVLGSFGCSKEHIFICIFDESKQIDEAQNSTDGFEITYSWTNEKGYYSISVYSDDKVWLDNMRNNLKVGDIQCINFQK